MVEQCTIVEDENNYHNDDSCKIFVSRVPSHFDEESVKRLLEKGVGENSVSNVALVYENDSSTSFNNNEDNRDDYVESRKTSDEDNGNNNNNNNNNSHNEKKKELEHRGFGFVTLATKEFQQKAIELGTVRGGAKETSKKKYTIYLRPILRSDVPSGSTNDDHKGNQICYLWSSFRCPYGDECKFAHEGEGGCANKEPSKKKQKCFKFKKGKCKLGDECPYYHDVDKVQSQTKNEGNTKDNDKDSNAPVPKSEKDCINWKTKGKCRKGDKCPYKHDDALRDKVLSKKGKRKADGQREKSRQPLSIRVFGLNYDTTQEDVRSFFEECGKIVEITFPRFEDSGRSKGFCGVLFQSPKAVAKAVALNGQELHGRWLSIQEGKMYLRQWEEQQEKQQQGTEAEKTQMEDQGPSVGEFGQKVKKRKTHGYKD